MLSCRSYISWLKPSEFWRIQVRHGVARMDGRKSQLDHVLKLKQTRQAAVALLAAW